MDAGTLRCGSTNRPAVDRGEPTANPIQKSAFCVLSDSGTITEESSLLDFPAITLRTAHERPEGMDVGTLIMTGPRRDDILHAIRVVTSQHTAGARQFDVVPDYDVANVSRKILRAVLSYTGYVNRTVWRKPD